MLKKGRSAKNFNVLKARYVELTRSKISSSLSCTNNMRNNLCVNIDTHLRSHRLSMSKLVTLQRNVYTEETRRGITQTL